MKSMLPWRKAESLQVCSLFWMPARFHPMPDSQKEWLLRFLQKLELHFLEGEPLTQDVFLMLGTVATDKARMDMLLRNAMRDGFLMGQVGRPDHEQRQSLAPSKEDIDEFRRGKKSFNFFDYSSEKACWLQTAKLQEALEGYFGLGAMTLLMRKASGGQMGKLPDAKLPSSIKVPRFLMRKPAMALLLEDFNPAHPSKLPPVINNHPGMQRLRSLTGFDPEKPHTGLAKLHFQSQTRDLFGRGLTEEPGYEGMPYFLPRLVSADFFSNGEETLLKWFEVFEIYIAESPEDDGVLIASRSDITSVIEKIVEEMHNDGYRYWEG